MSSTQPAPGSPERQETLDQKVERLRKERRLQEREAYRQAAIKYPHLAPKPKRQETLEQKVDRLFREQEAYLQATGASAEAPLDPFFGAEEQA